MELIITGDGSHTLFDGLLDETYHSRHGAIRESMHVFIWNGLRHYIGLSGKKNIRIFELGLGTGLNVLLTAHEAAKSGYHVLYTVIEPFPLESGLYRQLNYSELLPDIGSAKLLTEIHEAGWESAIPLSTNFTLQKIKLKFEDYRPEENRFDIIYYDAFAPGKQPEIWEPRLLAKAASMMKTGGILVTYCSQGKFKRDLREIGFRVEVLQGPPGKKEMVRAVK